MNIKDKIKTLIYIFFGLLFISGCCICNISYAQSTTTVSVNSSKEIYEENEEIEVTVLIENAKTVAFSTYIYFDNLKLEYISGPENVNVVENYIVYVWYDKTGGNTPLEGEVAKFKFKAKERGIATFSVNGEFYDNQNKQIETNFKDVQIKIGKEQGLINNLIEEKDSKDLQTNNANLQILRLDREGITPNFKQDVYKYYITVPIDVKSIEVLAIGENPNSIIDIKGNDNLITGLNVITINVLSEDRTQSNVYTIEVTKTDNESSANTNLEILAVENVLLNPPFEPNITQYNVNISNQLSNLNIFAVPEDPNATVQINGNSNLNEGNNLITITVTAQNGFSKKLYVLDVYKRNYNEEIIFKNEQEDNIHKLEEIYQLEKTSENSNILINENKDNDNKKFNKQKSIFAIGFLFSIIVIIVVCIFYFKFK